MAGAAGAPPTASGHVASQLLGSCEERVQDGGFEAGSSALFWSQSSTNYGTPLCTIAACTDGGGTASPHGGSWWAWFGGIKSFEQGVVSQAVTLPPGPATARLRFYLRIGARSGNGSDFLRARVDGNPVFAVTEATAGYGAYTLVDVDISTFATAGSHVLRIEGTTFGPGPGVTNFSVDDVSIEWCSVPSLSVSDVSSVAEGNAGATNAAFSVSLSQPTSQPVTVGWATADAVAGASATAGADYTPRSGLLSFPPGIISLPLAVPVLGDVLDEFDERFVVNLAGVTGATIADASGEATITDDDPLPTVSIGDVTLVEGNAGSTAGQVAVSITPVSGRAVSGAFATMDGTALAGVDYTAISGPFTIPAGATSGVVTVPVLGDTLDEPDEIFTGSIASPDHAVLGNALAVATIDDDDGPLLAVGDATVSEGNGGVSPATFGLSLSAASPQPVTLSYTTADGTATSGSDFAAISGSLTFAPGVVSASVAVPVFGDTLDEPNEFFSILLSNAVDASPSDAQGRGLIVDDDGGSLLLAGELAHGFEQWRNLGGSAAPRDLFLLARPPHSSFEVLVDGASGDVGAGAGPHLRRLAADLSTVLQSSVAAGSGPVRALRVRNEQLTPVTDYVEVASAACSTDCGPDDVYRISTRETTLSAPRFNNGGGQVTLVLLQNRTNLTVAGTLWFWAASGGPLATAHFSLDARQSFALNSTTVAALAGRNGSVTVTHDGPYGGLTGKTVALDPLSGLSFDTPLEVRR